MLFLLLPLWGVHLFTRLPRVLPWAVRFWDFATTLSVTVTATQYLGLSSCRSFAPTLPLTGAAALCCKDRQNFRKFTLENTLIAHGDIIMCLSSRFIHNKRSLVAKNNDVLLFEQQIKQKKQIRWLETMNADVHQIKLIWQEHAMR